MTIKMVSLDVDGTLLASDGSLPAQNRAAIVAALTCGVRIVLNTGKPPSTVMHLSNELGLKDPMITMAGALILQQTDGDRWQVLQCNPLPQDILRRIAPLVDQLPLSLFVLCLNDSYIFHAKSSQDYLDYFKGFLTRNYFFEYTLLEQSPLIEPSLIRSRILKIMFHSKQMKPLEEAYQRLSTLKDRTFTIGHSSPGTIDLSPKSCGKRQAIEDLCARFNIQRSEVMALGDYETDLELIQWAGIGAVMANAPASVRAQAPIVAPSNDHAGVATMLIRHVLERDPSEC